MKLDLKSSELEEMRRFYEEEMDKTVVRLRHLQSVLGQLGGPARININFGGDIPSAPGIEGVRVPVPVSEDTSTKRKRRKKRGRKSIWGEFILTTLKRHNRPMKYSEIIQSAKMQYNLPESRMKQLKAAINQSAFRLRTVHNKIDTVGEDGKKEKYIILSTWLDENKNLEKRYARFIK
jgi:hypothetical protein